MPHHRDLEDVSLAETWLTIGSFDGVHLGHQFLIKKMVESAHSAGQRAAVLTFFPHPVVVLRGLLSPYYLTTPDEKASLLLSLGVDDVITMPFTRELAGLTALEFMQKVKQHITITNLWVGYDFALGRNREGDIPTLTRIGEELGYQTHIFKPVSENGEPISSRLVRRLLSEGEVGQAASLLGRYYDISGKIVHGDGRGRLIGIPTTNLEYDLERLLPRPGIYATFVHHAGKVFPSVTNIGTNPTFITAPMAHLRVETHLLDFSGDLYGSEQHLDFVKFIRPEAKFNSVEALVQRINEDILIARQVLPPFE
jgi:riboflavin kinase / FMN adenylyltransferase